MTYIIYVVSLFVVLLSDTAKTSLPQGIDMWLENANTYSEVVLYFIVGVYVALGLAAALIGVVAFLNKKVRGVIEGIGRDVLDLFSRFKMTKVSFSCGCCFPFIVPVVIWPVVILFLPGFAWINWKLAEFLSTSFLSDGSIVDPVKFWGTVLLLVLFGIG